MSKITRLLTCAVFVVWSIGSVSAQSFSQDPGHKEFAETSNVKFSVPNSFNVEKPSDSRITFMRHKKYDLALFVAVPEKNIDENYLTNLSNALAQQLFSKEKDFRWKVLPLDYEGKVSKFQTSSGNTKGFNGKTFFQTDFIVVKIKDQEILVGYITQLGQYGNNQKYLFDLKGVGGMSMPGWYAQAHILASITGEKYEAINPGTVITGTPVKKN